MTKRFVTLALTMLVTMVAWAQNSDFGSDDVISTTTLWTFDQYQVGDIIANNEGVNFSGLYIKSHSAEKPSKAESKAASFTFDNKTIYTINSCKAEGGQQGDNSFAKGSVLNSRKASSLYKNCIAINISTIGTLYIGASANNKTLVVYRGNIGEELSDESDVTVYTSSSVMSTIPATHVVAIEKPGTYWITASGAYNIYAIKFVPTSESTQTKTISMGAIGVQFFSDIHSWQVPEGLTAYYFANSVANDGSLQLVKIENDIIPACTGVVLYGTNNTNYTLTSTDAGSLQKTKNNDLVTALDQNYTLRPVIVNYSLAEKYSTGTEDSKNWDNYIISNVNEKIVLTKASGSGTVSAGEAYYRIRRDQVKGNVDGNIVPNFTYYTLSTSTDNGTISVKNGTEETNWTSFLANTNLTLTATGNENYHFTGWTINNENSGTDNPRSLVMDGNKTVTAIMEQQNATNYTVTITSASHGVVTANQTAAPEGTTITLSVQPDAGYQLKEGTLKAGETALSVSNNTATFNLNSDVTITAEFEAISYTITYNGVEGATFTSENPTSYTIESETFSLVNPTKEGHSFTGWTGTGLEGPTETVTITKGSIGDRSYTATWTENAPAVTTISDVTISGLTAPVKGNALTVLGSLNTETTGATISGITWDPSAETAAASTAYTATVTLTADTGYQFASTVTANAIAEKAAIVTRTDDIHISVSYTFDETEADVAPATNYTLTTNIVGNGTITVNDVDNTGSYAAGSKLVLKAAPNSGSLFLNWSDGTNILTNAPTYTIESLSANTTLTANFKTVEATVPVILTAGQSNTDGRAQNDSIPYYIKSQGSEYPNVYWSYGNATNDKVTGTFDKFWPACDAGNGRWAYDAVVYYHLQKTLNGSDLYVIKESKGNTAINTSCATSDNKWWSADATWLSTATSADADGQSLLLALRDNIDKSLATLADAGKAADIKFLMWHQGEADRSKGSEYQTQLQQVIDYVRQYLVARTGNSAYSTLPVILGGIKSGTSQYKAEVESAKQTIANNDANIYYVSTDDIPVNGLRADNLHFNAKGAEMLGKKVYDLIATNHLLGEYTYAEKEKSIFRPDISFDETTQKVTITPDTNSEVTGADSYYTLDGTTPTTSSNKYTAAFTITESCTVTANSIGSNGEESCTNKLEISLAPMPVVYDFATTTDNINAEDKTKSRNLWYKDQESTKGFRYVLNGSSKLRVLTYSSTGKFTQGTGLYLDGSNRAFAIEGISNGDMVRIVHNGTVNDGNYTDKTGISITDNNNQAFTGAIASGQAIKISKSGDLADYAVFLTASNNLTISQLAINKGIKPQVSFKEVSGSSKIYTVQFYEGETLHYTAPGITGEQTVAYSSDNNGMKDITVSENGDLVCWTTFGGTEVANESTRNTITISVTSDEVIVDLDENGSKATMTIENNEATLTGVTLSETATTITVSRTVNNGTSDVPVTSIAVDAFNSITDKTAIKAIDLSATLVTGIAVNRESGIFNGFSKETIIYLPSGTGNTAESQKNVVIGGTCSDFEMEDGESYSIPASRSFTATSASFKRTFTADQKCTVCLPYQFTATRGTFYEYTGIVDNQVKMTAKEANTTLSANTPYIFEPSSGATEISATNVTVSMSDAPKTENATYKFNFVGTYESKVWNEAPSGIYGYAAEAVSGATAGQFVRVGSGASIAPFRAYLEYTGATGDEPSTTRSINNLPEVLDIVWISASGGTTGINGLDHQPADDAPMYNLSGQRVDKSYKGIVIQNGKKMIKK